MSPWFYAILLLFIGMILLGIIYFLGGAIGMSLLFYGMLLLCVGIIILTVIYFLPKKSAELSVFSILILHIILFFAVMFPLMLGMGSKNPPQIFFFLFLAALVGIPVHFVFTVIGRRKKRKDTTYIALEEDCVAGIGEILQDGSGFGGVSIGTGGVRPIIGGTPGKSKLRGFRVPYSKIISVDLLVQESGIVLLTQAANYICYIDNAQAVQEAIVKRIS